MTPGPTGRTYVVRLGTWHCTCAGFAFAMAVRRPAAAAAGMGTMTGGGKGGTAVGGSGEGEAVSFGGTSVDGADEGTPVCKHLLACLLAERWRGALGRYVVERRVGREEMAGVVADV